MKVIVRKYVLGADGEETLHCAPALTFNGQSHVRAFLPLNPLQQTASRPVR